MGALFFKSNLPTAIFALGILIAATEHAEAKLSCSDARVKYLRVELMELKDSGSALSREENLDLLLSTSPWAGSSPDWKKAEIYGYANYALPYAGVYNPKTGETKWKRAEAYGYAHYALPFTGVYNPKKGKIEWKQAEPASYGSFAVPYAGVFNPRTGETEWRKASISSHGQFAVPYTGVYNPKKGEIEWKEAGTSFLNEYVLPYSGVFNPKKGETEWKQAETSYLDKFAVGSTGVFNVETGAVDWKKSDASSSEYELPYAVATSADPDFLAELKSCVLNARDENADDKGEASSMVPTAR